MVVHKLMFGVNVWPMANTSHLNMHKHKLIMEYSKWFPPNDSQTVFMLKELWNHDADFCFFIRNSYLACSVTRIRLKDYIISVLLSRIPDVLFCTFSIEWKEKLTLCGSCESKSKLFAKYEYDETIGLVVIVISTKSPYGYNGGENRWNGDGHDECKM